jgi:hypothetical protein
MQLVTWNYLKARAHFGVGAFFSFVRLHTIRIAELKKQPN